MGHTQIHQKLIVPLSGVEVATRLHFSIGEMEFVDRLTAHLFRRPIPLNRTARPSEENETISIQVPTPATEIHVIPWARDDAAREEANKWLPVSLLPEGFDVFDNLGPIAFRAGRSGLGGFQTITTISTRAIVPSLLLVEFDQACPDNALPLLGSMNPYESNLVESLLDGMRLFFGNEPHPYKGYHISSNELLDSVIKWPLTEIQGNSLKLAESHLPNMKQAFLQVWQVRIDARQSASCKILTLAAEYYYLSSTMTETRVIFLYLMIAFEALFKRPEENSASAASSRLAKLLTGTKKEYNEIRRFMWNTGEVPGCCQLRNEIVHGGTSALRTERYWRLRDLIRRALFKLMSLVLSAEVDSKSYYQSVSTFVEQRFKYLPNC